MSPSFLIPAAAAADGDECGVCLDVGDFILTRPCEHKICGEGWGQGGEGGEGGGRERGTPVECA